MEAVVCTACGAQPPTLLWSEVCEMWRVPARREDACYLRMGTGLRTHSHPECGGSSVRQEAARHRTKAGMLPEDGNWPCTTCEDTLPPCHGVSVEGPLSDKRLQDTELELECYLRMGTGSLLGCPRMGPDWWVRIGDQQSLVQILPEDL